MGTILFIIGNLALGRERVKKLVSIIAILSFVLLFFLYFKQAKSLGFVAEGRERIIRKILLGVAKKPIIGWGWANVDYAFEEGIWPIKLEHEVYVDKAHSMFLEILTTTGIIGLSVYIFLLI